MELSELEPSEPRRGILRYLTDDFLAVYCATTATSWS